MFKRVARPSIRVGAFNLQELIVINLGPKPSAYLIPNIDYNIFQIRPLEPILENEKLDISDERIFSEVNLDVGAFRIVSREMAI